MLMLLVLIVFKWKTRTFPNKLSNNGRCTFDTVNASYCCTTECLLAANLQKLTDFNINHCYNSYSISDDLMSTQQNTSSKFTKLNQL